MNTIDDNPLSRTAKPIRTRKELLTLARDLGVRPDWHEPDEEGVDAVVCGNVFDNADRVCGSRWCSSSDPSRTFEEIGVYLMKDGEPVASINLANLFAFACTED